MSLYHDSFDFQISCEETFNTDPAELAEVQTLMAETSPDDDAEWLGYEAWSRELEREAWEGAQPVQTEHGEILIKKACEHTKCPHIKCLRSDLRLEGFAI